MIVREEQRTETWLKERLGNITGSEVGKLMKSSRTKGETFGDTAKSYIYRKAAERDIIEEVKTDDELWQLYTEQYSFTSKAMQFGTDQEANARRLYERITGNKVEEVGSCPHDTIPNFASSPDGITEDNGKIGAIEIKCPNLDTYYRYRAEVHDGASLLNVNPDYYYQCLAHMMCTGAKWTDFVCFQPFLRHPIHIVRIFPDKAAMDEMERRIREADDMIEQLLE